MINYPMINSNLVQESINRRKDLFMKNKKMFFTTKWICYTAMLTGLVVATSFIPPIPIPPFGSLYWCDGIIYVAAYLVDPLASFIIGGVGTFLYDVIHGNAAMMFASLLIHGLQAAVVSALIRYVLPKAPEVLWSAVASIAGAIIVIGGYFVLRFYIQGNVIEYCGFRAVANVIQEIVGIAIGIVLCYATTFKHQLEKNRLIPDFKNEVLEANKTE